MQKKLKNYYKYYRLSYNIFSTIFFLAIMFYAATIPSVLIYSKNPYSNYIGLMLAVLGIIIGKRGFKPYDTKEFLGIKQIETDKNSDQNNLKTNGILGRVRHPLYSATILIFLGFFLYAPTITNSITTASALLYLVVGIHLEEKKLINTFGKKYIEYKRSVPMLIPRFWK